MSNLVPYGSYGPMEHPDYWATDPEDDDTPDDGPTMPATVTAIRDSIRAMRDAAEARGEDWTGWYDAHEGADARPQPTGFCECGSPWCGDSSHADTTETPRQPTQKAPTV